MKKVKFIFCVHNHQPVGNFDHVLEESFEKSYSPFIEVLLKHPSVKVVMHFSGNLLLWFAEKKKDYISKIRELVRQGRVEIISSGIFEPVLAVLPEVDKIGQVTRFNSVIEEITGYTPKGAWLTERIYEPQLPKYLKQAGIEHIVVDDYHFIKAGLTEKDMFGYYVTEEEGHKLKVFPGSEKLRYLIPFKDVNETLEHFKMVSSCEKGNLTVFADDGEKFGSWPNTYGWVFEQHWLENFFNMLEANKDLVETVTFDEYAARNKALGRVYLPTTSYMEMGEWTLPADAAIIYENAISFANETGNHDLKRFLSGGIWRNYFAKYPESNNMHKKMLYVSEKIHNHYKPANEKRDFPEYLTELYKSQCNDAYWHGIFGGLYLPHLRDAVYRHMINAEILLEKETGQDKPYLLLKSYDINKDCEDEIIVESNDYNMYLQPGCGGTIYEYDYKPALFNIMNTLTRRKEAYHNKILAAEGADNSHRARTIHEMIVSKEEGLDKFLTFDSYNKVSLIDHFFDNVSLEDIKNKRYAERGDFIGKEYEHKIIKDADKPKIVLKRESFVRQGDLMIDIELKKVITLNKGSTEILIDYFIKNLSDEELTSIFGVEFNIMLLSPHDENRFFKVPGHVLKNNDLMSEGELYNVKEIRMVDRYFNFDVCFGFPQGCNFYRFPVETVSTSEGGFERIFQASTLLFFKMLTLAKDDEFVFPIRYAVKGN
jgi:alpha-amylase